MVANSAFGGGGGGGLGLWTPFYHGIESFGNTILRNRAAEIQKGKDEQSALLVTERISESIYNRNKRAKEEFEKEELRARLTEAQGTPEYMNSTPVVKAQIDARTYNDFMRLKKPDVYRRDLNSFINSISQLQNAGADPGLVKQMFKGAGYRVETYPGLFKTRKKGRGWTQEHIFNEDGMKYKYQIRFTPDLLERWVTLSPTDRKKLLRDQGTLVSSDPIEQLPAFKVKEDEFFLRKAAEDIFFPGSLMIKLYNNGEITDQDMRELLPSFIPGMFERFAKDGGPIFKLGSGRFSLQKWNELARKILTPETGVGSVTPGMRRIFNSVSGRAADLRTEHAIKVKAISPTAQAAHHTSMMNKELISQGDIFPKAVNKSMEYVVTSQEAKDTNLLQSQASASVALALFARSMQGKGKYQTKEKRDELTSSALRVLNSDSLSGELHLNTNSEGEKFLTGEYHVNLSPGQDWEKNKEDSSGKVWKTFKKNGQSTLKGEVLNMVSEGEGWRLILGGPSTKTGYTAFDQALVVAFIKAQDFLSVVRESEFARTFAMQSLWNRMVGKVEQWAKGGAGLTPDDRDALQFVIHASFSAANRRLASTVKEGQNRIRSARDELQSRVGHLMPNSPENHRAYIMERGDGAEGDKLQPFDRGELVSFKFTDESGNPQIIEYRSTNYNAHPAWGHLFLPYTTRSFSPEAIEEWWTKYRKSMSGAYSQRPGSPKVRSRTDDYLIP